MDNTKSDLALFRYAIIRDATDDRLTKSQRGALVRDLASRLHHHPSGRDVTISRHTLDRWLRAYRIGGFDALLPAPGSRQRRTPAELLDLAVVLKTEEPARTAAQVATLIVAAKGNGPSVRTLQRHFAQLGLHSSPGHARVFGRFEAEHPNDRWTGDGLHGPIIDGAKTLLVAYIDDHSRLVPARRWARSEDTLAACRSLRRGLQARGIPRSVYLDNGSAFSSKPLMRACATLGIRLIHSRPGLPEGRGKIERFFRTVRDQFLVEVSHSDIGNLDELNDRFDAWVETVYHRRAHSETKQTPLERFNAAGPQRLPSPLQLREAFLWSETRTVTKTATVSLWSNVYEVNPSLVGRRVELVFDPFDLEHVDVHHNGRVIGAALAHIVRTHVHPMIKEPEQQMVQPTGIDYLQFVADRHDKERKKKTGKLDYSKLVETKDPNQIPGQLEIPESEAL
jgi:putative transposase